MDDGRAVTMELYEQLKSEELEKIKLYVGDAYFEKGKFQEAEILFDTLIKSEKLADFLTIEAYKHI